jgi:hypothetical protein
MQARKLVERASFGPDTLKALYQAFDEAWAILAPRYANDASAAEAARTRLADLLLSVARAESRDVNALRDAALQRFRAAEGDQ